MRDIIIDLDDLDDLDDLSDDQPRPSRPGRGARPFLTALLLLITLFTIGAASPQPGPRIKLVAEIPVGREARLLALGTNLIVSEPDLIYAYDLRTGGPRWRLESQFDSVAMVWQEDDFLLAVGERDQFIQTIAIDAGTGAVRWRLNGYTEFIGGDLLAVHASPMGGLGEWHRVSFHLLDGSPIWTLEGGRSAVAVDAKHGLVGRLDRMTGELDEYDIRTGELLRHALLAEAIKADHLWYEDNGLFVIFQEGEPRRYDRVTLKLGPGEPVPHEMGRFDCGKVWCEPDGNGLALFEKISGHLVFRSERWHFGMGTRAGVLGLMSGPDEGLVAAGGLFNPDTGKVTDLGGWMALNVGYAGPPGGSDRPIYLKSGAAGVNYLAVIDRNGLQVLGVMPHSEIRVCDAVEGLLACKIGGELVRIWRLA